MRGHAFTLIELVIAIALGVTICLTAFAAVRMASSVVTAANRLSIHNSLLRTAVTTAIDDLDFWHSADDLTDTNRQPLRSDSYATGANPFRPMRFDANFDVSRSRSWWRGCPVGIPGKSWGDYSVFARQGHPDPDKSWWTDQFLAINATLGTYGLIEYMPAHTLFGGVFDAGGASLPEFYEENGWPDAAANPRVYVPNHMIAGSVRDLWSFTHSNLFCVTTNPDLLAAGVNRASFIDYSYGNPGWWRPNYHALGGMAYPLLDSQPDAWPAVDLKIRRFIYYSRFANVATIVLRSPLSGETLKVDVCVPSTTLRGARQQRGLDTYR